MATIKHKKHNNIADWTQLDVNKQIAAGNLPVGTVLADITLTSDWNDEHDITGLVTGAAGSDGQVQFNNASAFGGFGNYDVVNGTLTLTGAPVTVDDVTGCNIYIDYGYSSGNYFNNGYSTQGRVFAYKDTGLGRVYSTNYFETGIVTDNGGSNTNYGVVFDITPVTGADGYVVVLQDDYDGVTFASNYGFDTNMSSFTYGGDNLSSITPDPKTLNNTALITNGLFQANSKISAQQGIDVVGNYYSASGGITLNTGNLTLNSGTLYTSTVSTSNLNSSNGYISTLNAYNFNTTNLTASSGTITSITGTSATIGSVTYNSSAITFPTSANISTGSGYSFNLSCGNGANTTGNGQSPNPTGIIYFLSGAGGTASGNGAAANTGGTGGGIIVASGNGGSSAGSTTSNTGGNGGTYQISTGNGGKGNGTSGGTNISGQGGNLTIFTGTGGASTATGVTTNIGGNGGGVSFTAGSGGNASGASTTNTAGRGADCTFSGGTGGTASGTGATAGRGGDISFIGGDSGAGSNQRGGNLYFIGGLRNASGDNGNVYLNYYLSGATRGSTLIGNGNSITAAAQLHVISTTEQLRLNYSSTVWANATVASTGVVTLDANGSTPRFQFSDGITLAAGTSTAGTSPLKFLAGTNMTTAEVGAMEYNGTNLFFTRAGTVRENVLVAVDNVTAPTTSVGVAIVNYYGSSATNFLGTPNRWISVNILGSTYKIPLYT